MAALASAVAAESGEDVAAQLRALADSFSVGVQEEAFAHAMDEADPLREMRSKFHFPPATAAEAAADEEQETSAGKEGGDEGSGQKRAVYLVGNSLGLQPRATEEYVMQDLRKWARTGVEGHFTEPMPWVSIDDCVLESLTQVVGAASTQEVVAMNSLTTNLHLMLLAFYRPTPERHMILMEGHAFPSDTHAIKSQIEHHGFSVEESLRTVEPREGEHTLRTEDIEAAIERDGDRIAVVMFSGVQYYTGQFFDIARITQAAHAKGCLAGFDLAHAVGNVPLSLHDWDVDFACWCTYKYLNSGPGCIGGAFVHERHGQDTERNRMSGWWGHRFEDRFQMKPEFVAIPGAYGFRLSNPPTLPVLQLRASLDAFDEATMPRLRAKSVLLTGYMELMLKQTFGERVQILTPSDPAQRGCQLSLTFSMDVEQVFDRIRQDGVICDVRKPNAMRVAPTAMYNSFSDVYEFVHILRAALDELGL